MFLPGKTIRELVLPTITFEIYLYSVCSCLGGICRVIHDFRHVTGEVNETNKKC